MTQLRGYVLAAALAVPGLGQLVDKTLAPNAANEGIAKSLAEQIGTGRGDIFDTRFFGVHHSARPVPGSASRSSTFPA